MKLLFILILLHPIFAFSQDPTIGSGNYDELVLSISDLTPEGKQLRDALSQMRRGNKDCDSQGGSGLSTKSNRLRTCLVR